MIIKKGFIAVTVTTTIILIAGLMVGAAWYYQAHKTSSAILIDAQCKTYQPDNCPISCVVCPPCASCSSIGCRAASFCQSINVGRNWYESVKNNGTNVNSSTVPSAQVTTLVAVGDIMLSRNVEQKMIKHDDWLYPFRETYQVTTKGDIVFGNLESPIIAGPIVQTGSMVFRTDPQAVAGLTFGGFNVLSLANNHIKNQGAAGIEKTIEVLDQANITHAGAGLNTEQAHQPAILEKNGIKFGILAYTYNKDAGTAATSAFLDEATLVTDLDKLRPAVDVMIVSMHAGVEYSPTASQQQENFAHTAVDYGATLVIGHHPHVVEPVEKYKDGYIFYSLGNFIFDQMWSEPTREGAIATIAFTGKRITDIKLTPVKIFDYSQPRALNDNEGQVILKRLTTTPFE